MTYEIATDAVLWKGRKIKGMAPEGAEVLHPLIARSGSQILVAGKQFKAADADTFKVLSQGYAADKSTVYRIMETKLKSLKAPNPATFVALGDHHGQDGKIAVYVDKKMVLPKGTDVTALRPLTDTLATDGTRLYYGARPFAAATRAGIDWSRANLRLLGPDNPVNMPPHVVTVGSDVWYYTYVGGSDYVPLDGANGDRLRVLSQGSERKSNYVTDNTSIWYKEAKLPVAATNAQSISLDLAEAGGKTFHGSTALDHPAGTFIPGPPRFGAARAVVSHHGLWDIPRPGGKGPILLAERAAQPPITDAVLSELLTRLVHFTRADYADAALHNSPAEAAKNAADELAAAPPIRATMTAAGLHITLPDDTTLGDAASCWHSLALRAHLHLTGGKGTFLSRYRGNWLPRSNGAEGDLIRHLWGDICTLVRAAWEAGAHEDARVLALCLFQQPPGQGPHATVKASEEAAIALAALPLDLIPMSYWHPLTGQIKKTTNLGVIKLMIEPDWIAHEDWRRRLDAIIRLHSVIHDTPKLAQIAGDVFTVLKTRLDAEPLPYLRDQLRITMQMLATSAGRRPKAGTMDDQRRDVLDWLIANGINVAENMEVRATL